MKTFGEVLRELMLRDRVSVAEIARAIGEPAKTVQEWVGPRGRTPRDLSKLPKLAEFFHVSVHHLLTGQEDPRSGLEGLLDKTEIHSGMYEITIKKVKPKA
jgi:transcriptional regulator with XRE-family HTH domain